MSDDTNFGRGPLRLVHSSCEQLEFDFDTPKSLQKVLRAPGKCELDRDRIVTLRPSPVQHRPPVMRLVEALRTSLHPYPVEVESWQARPPLLRVTTGTGYVLRTHPHTVRFPMAAVVRADAPVHGLAQPLDGTMDGLLIFEPPLVVIEGMSWRDARLEQGRRIEQYLDAGTRVVWVVDAPSETVHVFRAGRGGHVVTREGVLQAAKVLPNFSYSLNELFIRRGARQQPSVVAGTDVAV